MWRACGEQAHASEQLSPSILKQPRPSILPWLHSPSYDSPLANLHVPLPSRLPSLLSSCKGKRIFHQRG